MSPSSRAGRRAPTHSHPTTDSRADGVRVIAIAGIRTSSNSAPTLMSWTLAMGHSFVRAGLRILAGDPETAWVPDVVHAHDWLVAHPAITLAEFFDVPLVATIHATEAGRHSGWVSGSTNRQVHSGGMVAGQRGRRPHHLFGVDA